MINTKHNRFISWINRDMMNSVIYSYHNGGIDSWTHPFWTDGVETENYTPVLSRQDIQKLNYGNYAEKQSIKDYIVRTYSITDSTDIDYIIETFTHRLSNFLIVDAH